MTSAQKRMCEFIDALEENKPRMIAGRYFLNMLIAQLLDEAMPAQASGETRFEEWARSYAVMSRGCGPFDL